MFDRNTFHGIEKELILLTNSKRLTTEIVGMLRGTGGKTIDPHDESFFLDPFIAISLVHRDEMRLTEKGIDTKGLTFIQKKFDLRIGCPATNLAFDQVGFFRRQR